MIIRTVTVFDKIIVENYKEKLKKAAIFLDEKEKFLKEHNITLQTKRVSCSLFDSVKEELHKNEYLKFFKEVNEYCKEIGITFFNPGTLDLDSHIQIIDLLPEIMMECDTFNTSLRIIRDESEFQFKKFLQAAELFERLVKSDYHSTFRFSINANCPELIPFYPVSYYKGEEPRYAVGIQLATLVNELLDDSKDFDEIFRDLFDKVNERVKKLESLIVKNYDKYAYEGIDTSFAPMVHEKDSIGKAYERILKKPVGSLGTLSVTSNFTKIMKSLEIKKTGYCGIMLAILEDKILAKRFEEGFLDIQKLMAYSTVCACGLDTIPVSSKVTREEIAMIYSDINTLAFKHNKPLTARLMSILDSKPGDMTSFNSPFLTNTKLVI